MAPAPITGIGNIILSVRSMERSLAFYRDAVGLGVRMAGPEFAFLEAGGVTLCLRQSAQMQAASDGVGVEIVFDVRDVQSAYEALKARGVAFRIEPRIVTGSLWAADFRDPDGHVLSIFGPSATGAQA
jgi:catechol 2,3-dioxygenase-like lactoylglutathione lyase family enzyme